jgi:hypothetical protein
MPRHRLVLTLDTSPSSAARSQRAPGGQARLECQQCGSSSWLEPRTPFETPVRKPLVPVPSSGLGLSLGRSAEETGEDNRAPVLECQAWSRDCSGKSSLSTDGRSRSPYNAVNTLHDLQVLARGLVVSADLIPVCMARASTRRDCREAHQALLGEADVNREAADGGGSPIALDFGISIDLDAQHTRAHCSLLVAPWYNCGDTISHTILGRYIPSMWQATHPFDPLGPEVIWAQAALVFPSHAFLVLRKMHHSPGAGHPGTPDESVVGGRIQGQVRALVFFAIGHGPCGCQGPWEMTLACKRPTRGDHTRLVHSVLTGQATFGCQQCEARTRGSAAPDRVSAGLHAIRDRDRVRRLLPQRLKMCTDDLALEHQLLETPCWWESPSGWLDQRHLVQCPTGLQMVRFLDPRVLPALAGLGLDLLASLARDVSWYALWAWAGRGAPSACAGADRGTRSLFEAAPALIVRARRGKEPERTRGPPALLLQLVSTNGSGGPSLSVQVVSADDPRVSFSPPLPLSLDPPRHQTARGRATWVGCDWDSGVYETTLAPPRRWLHVSTQAAPPSDLVAVPLPAGVEGIIAHPICASAPRGVFHATLLHYALCTVRLPLIRAWTISSVGGEVGVPQRGEDSPPQTLLLRFWTLVCGCGNGSALYQDPEGHPLTGEGLCILSLRLNSHRDETPHLECAHCGLDHHRWSPTTRVRFRAPPGWHGPFRSDRHTPPDRPWRQWLVSVFEPGPIDAWERIELALAQGCGQIEWEGSPTDDAVLVRLWARLAEQVGRVVIGVHSQALGVWARMAHVPDPHSPAGEQTMQDRVVQWLCTLSYTTEGDEEPQALPERDPCSTPLLGAPDHAVNPYAVAQTSGRKRKHQGPAARPAPVRIRNELVLLVEGTDDLVARRLRAPNSHRHRSTDVVSRLSGWRDPGRMVVPFAAPTPGTPVPVPQLGLDPASMFAATQLLLSYLSGCPPQGGFH